MGRKALITLFSIIIIAFVAIVGYDLSGPRNYSWNRSYRSFDAQPFGCKIIYKELSEIFPEKNILRLNKTLFEHYQWEVRNIRNVLDEDEVDVESEYNSDEIIEVFPTIENDDNLLFEDQNEVIDLDKIPFEKSYSPHDPCNLISIGSEFYLSEFDMIALLIHVYQGNNAFLSAEEFEGPINDFIDFQIAYRNLDEANKDTSLKSMNFSLIKENTKINFETDHYNYVDYFESIPDNAEIVAINDLNDPLCFKINLGEGSIYISSTPIVFTNYFLLNGNDGFATDLLAHLPVEDTYWNNNYLSFDDNNSEKKDSLLSFVFREPALKWAFYLLLFGILTFMVFELKRKQKSIPVIKPPKNATLAFVGQISQMYYQNNDHKDIADKKIAFFLENIRSKYYVKSNVFDKEFYKKLSDKTGIELEELTNFFKYINWIQKKKDVNQGELIKLNSMIQNFKKKTT